MEHEEREAHLRHLERSYNEMKYKLEAENAAEFAAVDKVMQNYEMHLANIRSDFAVADAVSVWLKIEPDFKKANASDMVIGVAQDSLVRTVEGLLKTSYDTARNLVGAAVKKEREKRAAEPITVKAEEPAPNDDEEAKFVAALATVNADFEKQFGKANIDKIRAVK